MENFQTLFQKTLRDNKDNNNLDLKKEDAIVEIRNWYSDRYETLIVQRNILFLFVIFATLIILTSIYIVGQIASSKNIEPFVVEIEDKTGITNYVDPLARIEITSDRALSSYFVMKYIRSRETYDYATYESNYKTVVRLLCAKEVYNEFWNSMNANKNNPISLYGQNASTGLKLRSIQYLEDSKVQVRFTIIENYGQKTTSPKSFPKIVTMSFEFKALDLTEAEREINPLGFQVTSYRVDDEILY